MLEILLKQFGKEDKGFCGATRSIKSEPPPLIELLTWYCGSFRRCRCDMEGKKYVYYMLQIKNYKLCQYFENL